MKRERDPKEEEEEQVEVTAAAGSTIPRREKSEAQRRGEEQRRTFAEQQKRAFEEERRTAVLNRHRVLDRLTKEEEEAREEEERPAAAEGGADGADVESAELDEKSGRIKRVGYEEEEGRVKFEGGVRIEPFNLRQEREEGFFDRTGTYTEYRMPRRLRDAWLEGEYDEQYAKDMEEEADELERKWRAQASREQRLEREVEAVGKRLESDAQAKRDLLSVAASLLVDDGESVSAGLRRLAASARGGTAKKKKQQRPGGGIVDLTAHAAPAATEEETREDERVRKEKEKLNRLTDAADSLLRAGFLNVYTDTRAVLRRHISELHAQGQEDEEEDGTKSRRPKRTREEETEEVAKRRHGGRGEEDRMEDKPTAASGGVLWEYRMKGDETIHGPFGTRQMMDWRAAGFFAGEYSALVRKVTTESILDGDAPGEEWVESETVDFSKFL